MVKKSNTGTDERLVHKPDELSIHNIGLIIGPWKKLFTDEQTKILIAKALNYCAYHEGMHIVGYLITERRVCLILNINKTDIKQMLLLFYDSVRHYINKYRDWQKNQHWQIDESVKELVITERFRDLFKQYPLMNDDLVKLITGQKVTLPYYSPHLAILKDRVRNYNFCSAIDYSGAEGPVYLKMLHKQEEYKGGTKTKAGK
jgi:hypothetical protein